MNTETFPSPVTKFPEIVIGIVSPVGTDINKPILRLKLEFESKGYEVFHIKISSKFDDLAKLIGRGDLKFNNKYERIDKYINFGNLIRSLMGDKVLAASAISQITEARFQALGSDTFSKKVYIVDQLKSESELTMLREVYGTSFFQMSIYSARDVRVDHLAKQMAHDQRKRDRNSFREFAEKLVVRDEDETEDPHGQKVGKIFQLADVVINADRSDERNNVSLQVSRFVELLFGHNSFSPNRLEYGMYLAHSAALRSLDLSRQVGAAIFRSTGEVAALGANEVPKAGGGTYWADDDFDAREYKLNRDSNDERKSELLSEVLEITLGDKKNVTAEMSDRLKKSQFMDALEYGRIVHAEMSAMADAARLGIAVQGGTLYCTTFPCHMCAKHIVASGIAKMVFLEPYPKSLTSDLHSDSVKIEGTSRGSYEKFPSVEFAPFFGITPRRYKEFFQRGKRKINDEFSTYHNGEPQFIIQYTAPWYAKREAEIISLFQGALTKIADNSTEKQ